ncbi:MAG: DNA repair and recombination protein RadB [Candidatus Altiarchaeales archaeon]|nr:MAG: DNA repair and recombination protein RadB [Candidatus Altiarchaeales archaeon]
MIKIHKDFDTLLGGGLQSRCITHIYGSPGSGKTNIALMATANAVKNGKVIYIDSEGSFSVERLRQISGEKIDEVLKNLMLIEPVEFDEQNVAIKKLNEIVPKSNASLVIVDSIAVFYRLEEDKDIRDLGRQLSQLLRIARRYDIPVLITNQVYTDIDTGRIVPVGGDVVRYWAKIIIELKKIENFRIAILKKHKFLPENLKLEFRITDNGIEAIKTKNLEPEKVEYL